MSAPKLHRMLQLLCAIHEQPRNAIDLAQALGCSVPTVKLMIYELRDLGCSIPRVGGGTVNRYELDG